MIARLILAGASLQSQQLQVKDSPKLSPLRCAVDASVIRFLLVAGVEPTENDLRVIRHIDSDAKCEAIISLLLKKPSLIEKIRETELRELCTDAKMIERVGQQMKESEQEWQRSVWQFYHERVTELAMVFVDQTTFVIAEICFAEQNYLRQVTLHWVIDRIENVKIVKQ